MAVAVNLLVFAVKRMGKMDAKTITKGVLGLGGIMTAFGAMAKMTKGMKLGSSIALLLTMAGTMILFIEAFKQVEGMNADSMLKFAASLSATMLALSVAMKIISTIPISGALHGLGGFAILIAGVGAIVIALGALQNQWKGMTGFLESGGNVLGQIGRALGKFVGGIGAGIVEGLDLPQLGSDLSSFMTNASGFIEGAKTIDGSVVTGIGQLAAALLAIGGTEFVNALVTLFTGENPVTKFSKDLATLGSGLMGYANSIKGFSEAASPEDMSSSVSAAEGLANTVNKLPSTGGRLQEWMGWKDLTKFSTDILLLADGLKSYATSVQGFAELANDGDLEKSISTARALADLNNSLPTTGGSLQDWLGAKDLSLFSTQIIELADGLIQYATKISGFADLVTSEDLSGATSTATALSDLNNSLPTTGGSLQDWLGAKDLSLFSTQIVELASGLVEYATAIGGFTSLASEDDLASALDVAKNLSDLNSALPSTGGTLNTWLFGGQDLGLFATNIGLLGDGLKTFADSIGGVSYKKSEYALSVVDMVKEFTDKLDKKGGLGDKIVKFFSGSSENTLLSYSANMATVGQNLATFASNLSGADFSNTESATQLMNDMETFIGTLNPTGGVWSDIGDWLNGKKDIVGLSEKMAAFGTNFNTFSAGITGAQKASTDFGYVQTIIKAFETLATAVENGELDVAAIERVAKTIGDSFAASVKGAIENGASDVGTAATTISNAGTTAAMATYGIWYSTGQNLGRGLANGIAAMAGSVRMAATNVAAGATRAIRITWSVHSPSRVGRDLGMNFDLGIAGGLETYSKVVSSQAADMGQSVIDSASTMLRGTDSSIFDNIDPNPTISPVMDLTNIQNGVGAINGMFNSNRMVGQGLFHGMNFNRGVNSLNFDGARILGGHTNKDVVSELQSLADRFDELNEAVANMKVVLDSGELVGATSRKMDNQLGELAMRRGRGN